MGILRTDRITGLGGANAIKGSVEMRGRQNLRAEVVNGNADFNLLDSDFTIECWLYRGGTTGTSNSLDQDLIMLWNNTNNRRSWGLYFDSSNSLGFIGSSDGTNSDMQSFHSYTFPDANAWYHIAAVRISNTATVYVNGTSIGSATVTGKYYENTVDNLVVGGQLSGTNFDNKIVQGFLSNVRIIIGDGIYTGNFTPPTHELTVTPNTRLLCCQSSGNILQEATGKILTPYRSSFNDSFAKASTFTPNSPVGFSTTTDVGSQYGSTFDGFTNFSTSTYMVPPGGNTRERNRGRGVLAGGYVHPNLGHNSMMYIEIQTTGNAQDFGDLGTARSYFPAGQTSSSTRGLSSAGWNNGGINTIEFITIANTSNATDFGDTSIARMSGALSNQTRAVHAGTTSPFSNVIDFVTIATTGDAQNFGDLVEPQSLFAGASSSTRGVFGGGRNNTPSENTLHNTMQFITIATTGDAQDFGDLQALRYGHTGFSSPTRGIFAGGYLTPGQTDSIDFFTIATLGNSEDFGDLSIGVGYNGSVTNSTRGVITINDAPNYTNALEFITIATTGNAKDFGDADPSGSAAGKGMGDYPSGISDSHGGVA